MLCDICKQKLKPKHSDSQRNYYRGVVLQTIAEETGYSGVQGFYLWGVELILDWKDFLHGIVKGLTKKRTSTTLDKFEYSELIETAIEVARFLWIVIPEPIK